MHLLKVWKVRNRPDSFSGSCLWQLFLRLRFLLTLPQVESHTTSSLTEIMYKSRGFPIQCSWAFPISLLISPNSGLVASPFERKAYCNLAIVISAKCSDHCISLRRTWSITHRWRLTNLVPDRNESGMMLIKSHFLLPNLLIKSRVLFRESRVNNEKIKKRKFSCCPLNH